MGKLLHKGIDYTGVSPYKFVPITEADYNALTPAEQEDETKMYWIYDVDTVSADIDDEHASAGTVWSSEKVSSEISDVQDQVDTNTDDISTLNSALTDIEDISSQVSYDHTRIPTLWGLSVKKKNGICYIYMNYAVFNAAANNVTIVTGLPKCAQQTNGVMTGSDAGQTAAISAGGSVSWIATGGTALMAHIGTDYARAHWISMAYPIDES